MNSDYAAYRVLARIATESPASVYRRRRIISNLSLLCLLLAASVASAAPPNISPVADQFTREAPVSALQIALSADDPIDGDGIQEFSFTSSPVAAESFCSISFVAGAGTGTLTCDPQLGDGGDYTITVTATDDSLLLEQSSTQFILDVNTTPSIDAIGPQSVVEAGSLEIDLGASDVDPADGLAFSFSAAPAAAEGFCAITRDNGNGSGTLTCSPNLGDADSYTVTVTATDDATVAASASTQFALNVGVNQAPTADPVVINGTPVLGAALNGSYNYDDADGDAEGTSTFQWYRNGSPINNATGTSYTVVVADVETTLTFGVTPVALTGASPGTEAISPGVLVANSTPVLQDITNKSVVEGGTINIPLLASDPDGDVILFSHAISPPLPLSGDICAVTADNGAGVGTLTCAPAVGDEGTFTVTVTVTDDGSSPKSASDTFLLTVGPNQPPTALNVAVTGNATLGFTLTGTYQYQDAELDAEGTSTFRWLRDGIAIPGAVGTSYVVVVEDVETNLRFEVTPVALTGATPGTPIQSADFPIANQPPVVNNIVNQTVTEAASLDIALSATDPEGDTLTFTFTASPVQAQTFCSVTADDGNGAGTLTCSPAVGDAALGPYSITVTATDDASSPASGSDSFVLTVDANQPPTASAVSISGEPSFGEVLTGTYTYADAEGDLEGVSTYRWLRNGAPIPGATSITYTVVADDVETSLSFEVTPVAATGAPEGTPVVSAPLLVSNTAPSITGQNAVQVAEDTSREIVLTDLIVSDLDSVFPDDFTLSVRDGENYTRSGANGNTITPALNYDGPDPLTVPVTVNDGFVDSAVFNLIVTVTPVNDAPVIDGLVAPLSTPEDQSITIALGDLNVTDVDSDDVYPTGFSLQLRDGANYTTAGTIVTPAENFNGQITVPVTVTDPDGLASLEFPIPIAVTAVNDIPVLDTPIGDQNAIENSPFSLDVSGNFSDADGDTLTYSATGLPSSNNITINTVTGVISGTPRIEDARDNDPYIVTVTARDPAGETTIGIFDLTISALDRANLALSIDVSPDTGMPSDELRWTFTALNPLGPQPGSNVELTGSFIGTGLTVAAENGANCDFGAVDDVVTDFICIIGTLPVGASTPIVITTTTSQATEVVAFATVAGADNLPIDPNDEDNSDLEAAGVAEAFSVGAVQILGSASILSVTAGDVNAGGEGAIDLVVGTAAGQPVQIYLSAAPRESCGCLRDFLPSPVSINDTGANEGVALADFNRDGSLDLVVVNGSGPDRVFVNDGDGSFSPIATLESSFAAAVAVADFNLDGNPDIAVAEIGDLNRVYFGDGLGGFPGGSVRLGTAGRDEANSNDVAAADVNGDGRPDLVFANVDGASTIWLSDAGGGFTFGGRLPIGDALAVAAGDLNGDGRADLVFGRVPADVGDVPSNPVLLNDGSGGFGAPAQLLGISPTNDVHIGDVNNDGSPDLVFINESGVHQVWAAAAGGYTLQREQIIDLDAREGVLAHLGFTDTDTPGGLDLAMGGAVAGGIAVYLNDAAGNLGRGDVEPPVISLSGNASVSIESGMTYSDAGATADDNIDGDISADIRVTNNVNTAVVGSYTVSYDVTDFAGNAAATATRTVNVTPAAGSGGGGGGALSYWTALVLLGLLAVAVSRRPQVRAKRVRAYTRKQRILK